MIDSLHGCYTKDRNITFICHYKAKHGIYTHVSYVCSYVLSHGDLDFMLPFLSCMLNKQTGYKKCKASIVNGYMQPRPSSSIVYQKSVTYVQYFQLHNYDWLHLPGADLGFLRGGS